MPRAGAVVAVVLLVSACSAGTRTGGPAATSAATRPAGPAPTAPPGIGPVPDVSLTPGPPAAGPRSEADQEFVTHLVQHHRQAIELCRRALEHSNDPAVIALARQVRADQTAELAALVGWLRGWNQAVPQGLGGALGGHNDITDGSMSVNDWKDLAATPPQDLDVAVLRYLQMHNSGTRVFVGAYLGNELEQPENRSVRALAQEMLRNRSERNRQIGGILRRLARS